jgi:uncharacterized protein YwqG
MVENVRNKFFISLTSNSIYEVVNLNYKKKQVEFYIYQSYTKIVDAHYLNKSDLIICPFSQMDYFFNSNVVYEIPEISNAAIAKFLLIKEDVEKKMYKWDSFA